MIKIPEDIDTIELIQHAWYWDARITRGANRGYSFTYVMGPFLTKWGARREAKKSLKSYIRRHKIVWVK